MGSTALFAGPEHLANAILEYGSEKVASFCAGADIDKFNSYLKTCNFIGQFIEEYGITKVGRGLQPAFAGIGQPGSTKNYFKAQAKSSGGSGKVDAGKTRVVNTPEMVTNFIGRKTDTKEWSNYHKRLNDKTTYAQLDKKGKAEYLYYADGLHHDIEMWVVKGSVAKHMGSINPQTGLLYKGPKHKDIKL